MYVALSDAARLGSTSEFDPSAGGGLFALSLDGGARLWSTPPDSCGERRPCAPTQAAAVSAATEQGQQPCPAQGVGDHRSGHGPVEGVRTRHVVRRLRLVS